MLYRTMLAILVLACATVSLAEEARDFSGRVSRVVDGDTLDVRRSDGQGVRIRLAQIDAPEKSQPHGPKATAALRSMALDKLVRIEVVDTDRYGRTVGEVLLEGRNINREMVRLGHAWAYTRYATSLEVAELEDEARTRVRGLWKLPLKDREPPWEWRRKHRSTSTRDRGDPVLVCGAKKTCKEMTSCSEAKFHLEQCGLTRLDGDRDGVPCEAKCRE